VFSLSTATVTPEGTVIGARPMRDISGYLHRSWRDGYQT
jgi:hypothetical protein